MVRLYQAAKVSTHSRLKAAGQCGIIGEMNRRFNTQPPEGGWEATPHSAVGQEVSTHSRLKAAATLWSG